MKSAFKNQSDIKIQVKTEFFDSVIQKFNQKRGFIKTQWYKYRGENRLKQKLNYIKKIHIVKKHSIL